MLKFGQTYDEVYNSFRWEVPEFYNIGVDICDKWAVQKKRLALIYLDENMQVVRYTFRELKGLSNRLANAFRALDISSGDRIGILRLWQVDTWQPLAELKVAEEQLQRIEFSRDNTRLIGLTRDNEIVVLTAPR